jgi:hypothetical protein
MTAETTLDKPSIPKPEATNTGAIAAAAAAYTPEALRALKSPEPGGQAAGLSHLNGGTSDGSMLHQVDFAIAPCTPPGKNPLEDENNPLPKKYDPEKNGPKEPQPPKEGQLFGSPRYLPYIGMCPPDAPPVKPLVKPGDDLVS